MPGHNGGANWASSAVDPVNGELYIVSKNLPVMLRVEHQRRGAVGAHRQRPRRDARGSGSNARRGKAKAAAAQGRRALLGAVRLHAQPDERHGRDRPAVVASITAYDLNTGEIKWRVPHGGVDRASATTSARTSRAAPRS